MTPRGAGTGGCHHTAVCCQHPSSELPAGDPPESKGEGTPPPAEAAGVGPRLAPRMPHACAGPWGDRPVMRGRVAPSLEQHPVVATGSPQQLVPPLTLAGIVLPALQLPAVFRAFFGDFYSSH